jgi:hypothetical protein
MQVFQDNPDLVKELFNGKATKSTNRRWMHLFSMQDTNQSKDCRWLE